MATNTPTRQRRSVRTVLSLAALSLAALVGSAAVPTAAVAAPSTTDSVTRTVEDAGPAALGEVTQRGHTWDRRGHTWDRVGHTWDRGGSSRADGQDEPTP